MNYSLLSSWIKSHQRDCKNRLTGFFLFSLTIATFFLSLPSLLPNTHIPHTLQLATMWNCWWVLVTSSVKSYLLRLAHSLSCLIPPCTLPSTCPLYCFSLISHSAWTRSALQALRENHLPRCVSESHPYSTLLPHCPSSALPWNAWHILINSSKSNSNITSSHASRSIPLDILIHACIPVIVNPGCTSESFGELV